MADKIISIWTLYCQPYAHVNIHIEPIDKIVAKEVLIAHRTRLVTAITASLLCQRLANALYTGGVITQSAYNNVTALGLWISMVLLEAVEEKIETDSSAFTTFVSVLQSEPTLAEMAHQLLQSYCKSPNSVGDILFGNVYTVDPHLSDPDGTEPRPDM